MDDDTVDLLQSDVPTDPAGQFAAILPILHKAGDLRAIRWLADTHEGPLGDGARQFLHEEYGEEIASPARELAQTADSVEQALFQAKLALLERKQGRTGKAMKIPAALLERRIKP